jgi:hypothetical protein
MRSIGVQNRVPKVPADQLTRDRMLKHLRKLRWIGQELEAQKVLQVLATRGCSHRFQALGANGDHSG